MMNMKYLKSSHKSKGFATKMNGCVFYLIFFIYICRNKLLTQ